MKFFKTNVSHHSFERLASRTLLVLKDSEPYGQYALGILIARECLNFFTNCYRITPHMDMKVGLSKMC